MTDQYFGGEGRKSEAPSIFWSMEPGQTARGIFLGTLAGKFREMPVIFSLLKGTVGFLPEHTLLLASLLDTPPFSPVEITMLASAGRGKRYTVKSWPVIGGADPVRATISTALKLALDTLARIRGTETPPAPGSVAAHSDDDLPF